MKRLISIIALGILTMSLAGCVVVEENYHHWHGPRAVIVMRPRPLYVPPPYPYDHHHRGWHGHRGY